MSIIFSFGSWGGVYANKSNVAWRVCMGWVAVTILFRDFDYWVEEKLGLGE